MAKDLTNEEVQELAKKLKKTIRTFSKVDDVETLEDEEMEDVNGGFKSRQGYTRGFRIFCPNCGATKRKWFIYKGEYIPDADLFYCNKCGMMFAADRYGYIYETSQQSILI